MTNENRPKPFSKERTKATLCKIIFFYSIFYVVMKVIAAFKGLWVIPNLVLTLPYLIFAAIGFWMTKTRFDPAGHRKTSATTTMSICRLITV